jgi:hypothetical protein
MPLDVIVCVYAVPTVPPVNADGVIVGQFIVRL